MDLNFGAAPLGSDSCVVHLNLQNTGSVPAEWYVVSQLLSGTTVQGCCLDLHSRSQPFALSVYSIKNRQVHP